MADGVQQVLANLDFVSTTKLVNLPAGDAAGNAMEYTQTTNLLAAKQGTVTWGDGLEASGDTASISLAAAANYNSFTISGGMFNGATFIKNGTASINDSTPDSSTTISSGTYAFFYKSGETNKAFIYNVATSQYYYIALSSGDFSGSLPSDLNNLVAYFSQSTGTSTYDGVISPTEGGSTSGGGTLAYASAGTPGYLEFDSGNLKVSSDLTDIIALNTAKNSYPTGDATKVGYISVTGAANLDTMQTTIAANTAAITSNDTDIAAISTDLASNASSKGASLIGVQDSGGIFTATDVEGVLAELYSTATTGIQAGAITEVELNASVNASLDLADSALQAGDKGVSNGIAPLNGSGKIDNSYLSTSVMTYEGVYNASTNSPTLTDSGGDTGQVYVVTVSGTVNLGSGSITLAVGDELRHNGSAFEKVAKDTTLTNAEVKAAYEANADTNAYDDAAVALVASATQKYAGTVNLVAGTSLTVTHNLGTTDVVVMVKDSVGDVINVGINDFTTNTVDLTSGVSKTGVRVVVIG